VFGRGAESGVATIVARKDVGMRTTGGISATYEYIADVQPDSGEPAFRATFKEHFSGQFRNAGMRRPEVGEHAPVTFDPRSHKVEFDRAELRAEGMLLNGQMTHHSSPWRTVHPGALLRPRRSRATIRTRVLNKRGRYGEKT
jgi:hypothetical protein